MPQSIDLLQEDSGTIILEQLIDAEESRLILEQLDDGISDLDGRLDVRRLRRRRR